MRVWSKPFWAYERDDNHGDSICGYLAARILHKFCRETAKRKQNKSPPCLTKHYVYELFLEKANSPISKYHFYKLWKREMFNVTILKVPKYKKYLIVLNTSVYMEKKLYLNFVT